MLNAWDPQTGQPVNKVKDSDVKVAMSEVPSTPAYRQQTQANVATIIQALGNNAQAVAVLAPVFIRSSSNLQNRQQVADDLRKLAGLPIAGAPLPPRRMLIRQSLISIKLCSNSIDKPSLQTSFHRKGTLRADILHAIVYRKDGTPLTIL